MIEKKIIKIYNEINNSIWINIGISIIKNNNVFSNYTNIKCPKRIKNLSNFCIWDKNSEKCKCVFRNLKIIIIIFQYVVIKNVQN